MADVSFDTLAEVRQLEARGFNSDQAEAIVSAVRTGVRGGAATKSDLARLAAEIRTDLARLATEIKTDLLWMKRIGAVIVALLVVPLLRDLLAALN